MSDAPSAWPTRARRQENPGRSRTTSGSAARRFSGSGSPAPVGSDDRGLVGRRLGLPLEDRGDERVLVPVRERVVVAALEADRRERMAGEAARADGSGAGAPGNQHVGAAPAAAA